MYRGMQARWRGSKMTKTIRAIDSQDLAVLECLASLKDDDGNLLGIKYKALARRLNEKPDFGSITPKGLVRKLIKLEKMNLVRKFLTEMELLYSTSRYPCGHWIITNAGLVKLRLTLEEISLLTATSV